MKKWDDLGAICLKKCTFPNRVARFNMIQLYIVFAQNAILYCKKITASSFVWKSTLLQIPVLGAVGLARTNSTKRLDLSGQRFGKLTALRREANIGRDTAWLCRCDCGGMTVAKTASLRRGRKRDCGCGNKAPRLASTGQLDLTGLRFGSLTALEPLGKTGQTHKWLCRCDCGRECAVAVANLRNGHTRSCGCRNAAPRVTVVDGTCVELIRSNILRSNNTSGCTGVVWQKKARRWRAEIGFQGKRYYLGQFDCFDDAVTARKEAEAKYFGAFLAAYDAGTSRTTEGP